jgi:hypothetical protein
MPEYPPKPRWMSDKKPKDSTMTDEEYEALLDVNHQEHKQWESACLVESEAHGRSWINLEMFESRVRTLQRKAKI